MVDSEVSIYFRHILQHSLELDLFLGGEISSYLISIYNNLSAQFLSAYLEANTATLVDSEVSIYFRQILQHSLELDLFPGGEISSYLISIYNNLSAQLISAYLETIPTTLVDLEDSIYCRHIILQHSLELDLLLGGENSSYLITTYNNLSAQLISAYLQANPVSLVYILDISYSTV